jgi:uncharacterized protein (DUF433 family)
VPVATSSRHGKPPRTDRRFTVPLYSQAEAARYVDMPPSTLRDWAQQGSKRHEHPMVTRLPAVGGRQPTVPFIGLAEAMFLSALRRAGVPMQQIRPALTVVEERLGVAHALASRRLFAAGPQLLWEVATEGELGADQRRALIVLRDGQYVFREVIERYLRRIEYADDDYAARLRLPGYEVANLIADPEINFGLPFFADSGTPIYAVLSRIRAGEPLAEVAEDFELAEDQVAEVADRAEAFAA